MSDSLTDEERIRKMESELAMLKSKVRTKNLRQAIAVCEYEAAIKLEMVAAQRPELADLYGDADDAQEVLSTVQPRLKAAICNLLTRSSTNNTVSPTEDTSDAVADAESSVCMASLEQSDEGDGDDASYLPANSSLISTMNATREPGSFGQDNSLVRQLRSKMANICQDSNGKIVALACHTCGANMSKGSGVTARFSLHGLRIHYQKTHECYMTNELTLQVCQRTALTDQDIQDVLNGRKPDNANLQDKVKACEKRRSEATPANTATSPCPVGSVFPAYGNYVKDDIARFAHAEVPNRDRPSSIGLGGTRNSTSLPPAPTPFQLPTMYVNPFAEHAVGKRKASAGDAAHEDEVPVKRGRHSYEY